MNEFVVQLENVSMKYRLLSEKIDSLKHFLIKKFRREISYEEFYALKNINLSIKKGEVLGIVGMNGAGKSTLLKVIAGVLKPSEGSVRRIGSISPLIELGAGFNEDLTGAENIFLNGLLLGYPKKMLKDKFQEIVEFSEVGKFLHTPIKNYSSGMKVRLGFSIATLVQPEILIVDEVLAVGDFKFKEKSEAKIRSMMDGGTTVLFVSHTLSEVERISHRVAWLENGNIKEIGPPEHVITNFKNAHNE